MGSFQPLRAGVETTYKWIAAQVEAERAIKMVKAEPVLENM